MGITQECRPKNRLKLQAERAWYRLISTNLNKARCICLKQSKATFCLQALRRYFKSYYSFSVLFAF